MSLDLFSADQAEAINYARRTSAPNLPATFGDTFSAAWSHGALFGQSVSGATARRSVVDDYVEEIRQKHGVTFGAPSIDGVPDLSTINADVEKRRAADPSFTAPLTPDELDRRAVAKSRAARESYLQMEAREKTWGGTAGSLLGEGATQLSDPINLLAMPLAAPAGVGVLGTALAWGGIGVGTQGVIELAGMSYRDEVQPGYSSTSEPASNILGAAVAPAILGGGIKALASAWTRVRTGEWPRYVRDAGAVVDSEANIAATNPFRTGDDVFGAVSTAEAGVAHREALTKALDDVLAGRPVEVDDIVGRLTPREEPLPSPTGPAQSQLELQPPRSIIEPAAVEDMAADLTAARRKEIRSDPETDDAVAIDLDRMRATRDVQIPMGETVDATGQRVPLMRSIDDVMTEIDAREKAAIEIRACATPQPEVKS